MPLTPEQRTHLQDVINTFNNRVTAKYKAGVEEHGGNLWDNDSLRLIEMAIDEAVDQVVYLTTLRQKLVDHI